LKQLSCNIETDWFSELPIDLISFKFQPIHVLYQSIVDIKVYKWSRLNENGDLFLITNRQEKA